MINSQYIKNLQSHKNKLSKNNLKDQNAQASYGWIQQQMIIGD